MSRDGERYGDRGAVDRRNRLFKVVFDALQASVDDRDSLAGVGFSGWAGEGRHRDARAAEPASAPKFRLESSVYDSGSIYDNSVYEKDVPTIRLVTQFGRRWRSVGTDTRTRRAVRR